MHALRQHLAGLGHFVHRSCLQAADRSLYPIPQHGRLFIMIPALRPFSLGQNLHSNSNGCFPKMHGETLSAAPCPERAR